MDRLFRHIKPKTVLDIGANVGDFTRDILSYLPDTQVIMVEANPNCENALKNIEVPYHIMALSNYNGVAELFVENINPTATGASLYKENTNWYEDGKYHKITVRSSKLDDCGFFQNEAIDLIKLDVQGSELDIIKGGMETIKNANFVLSEVSLLQYNQGAPLIDEIVDTMVEIGFGMADFIEYHKSNGIIFQMDILFKNSKKNFLIS